MYYFFVWYILLFLLPRLNAILDGTTAPLYLDTRYTFTNYEWARGSVFFRDGFDVPTGGTVLLGIDGGFVANSIRLNGGTVRLERDVTLGSDGFFDGTGFIDMKGKKITFNRGVYPGLFGVGSYIKFLSAGTVEGSSRRSLIHLFDSTLDLRSVGGGFAFNELRFILFLNKLLLTNSNPSNIIFSNCDIAHNDFSIVFNNPMVTLAQNTSITSLGGLVFNQLRVDGGSSIVIQSGSKITTSALDIVFNITRLTINNSTLQFTSTGTGPIVVGSPTAAQGELNINGKCTIRSLSGNSLLINPTMLINLLPGSRIAIDNNTHLVVQG